MGVVRPNPRYSVNGIRVPEYSELPIRSDAWIRWDKGNRVVELGIFLAVNLAAVVEAPDD
jgi:hypothetical protein